MNTLVVSPKKRFPSWLRRVWQMEQVLVFVGVVVYAMLAAIGQRAPLGVIMLSILTVGNLVIPFGEERVQEAARGSGESALDIQRKIMQQVTAFCSGNFRDDATLLVLALT